jgi:hypothetical protein
MMGNGALVKIIVSILNRTPQLKKLKNIGQSQHAILKRLALVDLTF